MVEKTDLPPNIRPSGLRPPFGRRGSAMAAMTVVGAGMAFNWSWLAEVGAAPLILSLAPCAVMWAGGYCVMCRGKVCNTDKTSASNHVCPSIPKEMP